jgi:formylglycine-generating enzyme required for sulfatase activity
MNTILNSAQSSPEKSEKKNGEIFCDHLQDGSLGPEMIQIPAGRFLMGDIQGYGYGNEKPVHEVLIDSFAMGRYTVTFAEYDYFAETTDRKKPSDMGWGRGNRPIINILWKDVVAYTEWLSQQTGQQYRLPTEAEWEYAARADTETDYWWGNVIELDRANCSNCGSKWDNEMTAPVGSFASNPFGLYDTVGNVWEWTCSVYEEKFNGKEQCCANPKEDILRVIRGGSWFDDPKAARVSFRTHWWNSYINVGFRLVQDRSNPHIALK